MLKGSAVGGQLLELKTLVGPICHVFVVGIGCHPLLKCPLIAASQLIPQALYDVCVCTCIFTGCVYSQYVYRIETEGHYTYIDYVYTCIHTCQPYWVFRYATRKQSMLLAYLNFLKIYLLSAKNFPIFSQFGGF